MNSATVQSTIAEQFAFLSEALCSYAALSAADRLGILSRLEKGSVSQSTRARECSISERGAKWLANPGQANQMTNLITLCSPCHHRVEVSIHMRSGLAGLAYTLGHLAPLFLMCDDHDLGALSEPQSTLAGGNPVIILYDQIPAGIGLSQQLFEFHSLLIQRASELMTTCECLDGCPSCIGPAGENGSGGKKETLAILNELL